MIPYILPVKFPVVRDISRFFLVQKKTNIFITKILQPRKFEEKVILKFIILLISLLNINIKYQFIKTEGTSMVQSLLKKWYKQMFPVLNLYTQRNLVESTRNQTVFTIFLLIWHQTDTVRLIPNHLGNGKYNLISG